MDVFSFFLNFAWKQLVENMMWQFLPKVLIELC